ncbi:MAG TPA: hypothetical protein VNH11_24720 [Pirellulales bacterium]|nr:hypothetical protein [Pirellulales bacterium]
MEKTQHALVTTAYHGALEVAASFGAVFLQLDVPPELCIVIGTEKPFPKGDRNAPLDVEPVDVVIECEREGWLPMQFKDFANAKAGCLWMLRVLRSQLEEEIDRLESSTTVP